MKKLMPFVCLIVFLSCNSGTSKTSADSSSVSNTDNSKKASVAYPYPISYSSQFAIGDAEKSKMILDIWKDYDNNSLDNSKDKFADTVTMIFSGASMHGSRDNILAAAKADRGSYSSVMSKVDAVISTKSTDKDEDWVLVWGTETHTDKKNVTDSVHLQETWRLNKDGKVDYMMQFMSKPAKAKA